MKRPITVTDILNSVEFELLQHTLMQDDVADGIHRLRAYQADARNKWLQQGRKPSVDSLVELQINTNEMLLTLIQSLNHRLETLQQEFRRAAYLKQHTSTTATDTITATATDATRTETGLADDQSPDLAQPWDSIGDALLSETADERDGAFAINSTLDAYLTSELARVQMDVRESNTPVLGGVFNRVRMSLHELVLFYVNKVVEQQADVNRAYGDALRDLIAANHAQAVELQELRGHVLQLTQQTQREQQNDRDKLAES